MHKQLQIQIQNTKFISLYIFSKNLSNNSGYVTPYIISPYKERKWVDHTLH